MATSKVDMDQWQCGKSLPECLGFMLENEIACDVTFIVGKKKIEVKAHKTILIARSPVFYAMLNGPLKETSSISVPDIENDVFQEVLRYIYTDNVNLAEETAIPILYAAKKYCLDDLSERCVDLLESTMTEENICVLYEQAHMFDDQNLEKKCFEKIKKNTKKCLESPSFLELCHSCCEKVISSDHLCVSEEFIYERVIKWSEAECLRRQMPVSDINKRKVLGSILYAIRFPLLDKNYFGDNILNNDLLTSEEKLALCKLHFNASDSSLLFANKKRKGKIDGMIDRFTDTDKNITWMINGKLKDKIGFSMSQDIFLHGVVLFGDDKSSEYSVELSIKDDKNTTLSSIETKYKASPLDFTSNILLNEPIIIHANTKYIAEALISGPNSKKGVGGQAKLTTNGVTVTFFSLPGPSNGTSETVGQIPGLLCSF